ncbi:hypothetical protein JB92DRAFT_3144246 [Gautieria morchelliformis]|nr:hypothetical protein JB92DRAFT_3144246 [Gautieria morchelliformis]
MSSSMLTVNEASLAQDELLEWARLPSSRYFDFAASSSSSESPLPCARSYALSLAPALIPSSGPLINALILSGPAAARVPANKGDIFKAHDIALVDKRKLMRFLQFAAGIPFSRTEQKWGGGGQRDRPFGDFLRDKFALGVEAREAIVYALAYCASASVTSVEEPTLTVVTGSLPKGSNIRRQWFLGRKILSLQLPLEADRASIRLQDVPHVLTADVVIASRDYLPASVFPEPDTTEASAYVCGIVIVDRPIAVPPSAQASAGTPSHEAPVDDVENTAPDEAQLDTAVLMFAPGSLPEGKAPNVVRVLQMGEGTHVVFEAGRRRLQRRYQNIPLRNSIQSSVILTLLESVILGDPLAREVGHIAGSDLHVPVPVHGGMGTSLGAIARVRSKKAWPLAEGEFLSSENIKGGNGLPPGR